MYSNTLLLSRLAFTIALLIAFSYMLYLSQNIQGIGSRFPSAITKAAVLICIVEIIHNMYQILLNKNFDNNSIASFIIKNNQYIAIAWPLVLFLSIYYLGFFLAFAIFFLLFNFYYNKTVSIYPVIVLFLVLSVVYFLTEVVLDTSLYSGLLFK